jgi:glycosyltransferase involved in cell wall biosynthesis
VETAGLGKSILIEESDKSPLFDAKFAGAAIWLWENKEKREEVADYGYRYVNDNYSWSKVAERWQKEIISSRESWSDFHVAEALPTVGSRKASAVLS